MRSVAVIDQELSHYYRRREAVARASAHRAPDARARRMHLEMASMYAKALQAGCSIDDLFESLPTPYVISDGVTQMDEAA